MEDGAIVTVTQPGTQRQAERERERERERQTERETSAALSVGPENPETVTIGHYSSELTTSLNRLNSSGVISTLSASC
ncbi:hypothetical protein AOLI_G00003940 [Acnodon oligacanthus]